MTFTIPRRLIAAIVAAVAVIGTAILVAACTTSGGGTGSSLEQTSSQADLTIAEETLPAPVFPRSEVRYAFIQDQAAQALGEQTTSFVWNLGQDPKPLCPSIGFPVPNTAELTNPSRPVQVTGGSGGNSAVTVGNMDPNQLYTPASSSGTFVLCINRQGEPYTVYSEPNVVTVAGAATVVNGSIVEQGAPNMPVCKVANAGTKQARTTCTK
jgi:hypothetical protein